MIWPPSALKRRSQEKDGHTRVNVSFQNFGRPIHILNSQHHRYKLINTMTSITTFPRFSSLPTELQVAIWQFAASPTPKIHIVSSPSLEPRAKYIIEGILIHRRKPSESLWRWFIHTCREPEWPVGCFYKSTGLDLLGTHGLLRWSLDTFFYITVVSQAASQTTRCYGFSTLEAC